jgi:WXG100 family type VII secretion target
MAFHHTGIAAKSNNRSGGNMPTIIIRCGYDELLGISKMFSEQQSKFTQMNKRVKSAQETLKGGDWIGKGAKAFFKEMDGQVNPSLQRLERAMGEAANVTKKIHDIMHKAEDESSSIFKIF